MDIAITFSGNREYTVTKPLDAIGVEYDLNPDTVRGYDCVITDSPSVLIPKYKLYNDTVILRLRGNLWKERTQQGKHAARSLLSDKIVLKRVDGLLAPDSYLEETWMQKVGETDSTVVQLPIKYTDWQTNSHTECKVQALTLTNCDYKEKIRPMLEYVEPVNDVLGDGEQWLIAGDGDYSDWIENAVSQLSHVDYVGYVDANEYLKKSNVMFHMSEFDIQHPNAILEGVASNLPVVTNPFGKFVDSNIVYTVTPSKIESLINTLRSPETRRQMVNKSRETVKRTHAPESIGNEIAEFIDQP